MRLSRTFSLVSPLCLLLLSPLAHAQETKAAESPEPVATPQATAQATPNATAQAETPSAATAEQPAQPGQQDPSRQSSAEPEPSGSADSSGREASSSANAPSNPDAVTTPATQATPSDATQPEPQPIAGYKNGFFIQAPDGPYKLRIDFVGQLLAAWAGGENGAQDVVNFSVRRFRFRFVGTAFDPNFHYFFQPAFDAGNVELIDWWIDYGFIPEKLHVRVGQIRRPFSRQFIMPVFRTELVDRSIVDKAFGADRDIGIQFHNDYEQSPEFEWVVGVYNGPGYKPKYTGSVQVDPATGEGTVSNIRQTNVPKHFHPMVVARVGYNYGGIVGYSEADLEGGPFRFSVGAATSLDFDADKTGDGELRGTVDSTIKVHGFSIAGAGFVSFDDGSTAFTNPTLDAYGALVEGGYVIAEHVQPVGRWAGIFNQTGPDLQEILGGLSVYFKGHRLKLQGDGGVLVTNPKSGATRKNPLARLQLGMVF